MISYCSIIMMLKSIHYHFLPSSLHICFVLLLLCMVLLLCIVYVHILPKFEASINYFLVTIATKIEK